MFELSRERQIEFYKKMLLIRYFEERVSKLRYEGEIYGAVHCCIGQEAVSVGVCSALQKKDRIIGTHRSHGYMLAKGADVNPVMAELFGKKSGTNGGRGGSLHVCDSSVGALGATGIVGSGIPIACGSAVASKYFDEGIVSVVFLGDGASNEGIFYESLNLSSKWELPVVFVVENNGLAVTTKNTDTTANVDIYKHAESFGMQGQVIKGQDVDEVYSIFQEVIERVRKQERPELVEVKTYRFHEHAEGKGYLRMKGTGYRDEEYLGEVIEKYDPIKLYEKKLIKSGMKESDLFSIRDEQIKIIDDSVRFARESEEPDPKSAFDYVFSEG